MKSRINPKRHLGLAAIAASALLLMGCIYEIGLPAGEDQFGRLVPVQGMHQQTHVKDQANQPIYRDDQPEGMRYPPPNTVPVDGTPRDRDPDISQSAELSNPVPRTDDNLEYGRFLYEEQCAVCHGTDGGGQGTIVQAGHYQAAPPTFHNRAQRERPDGEIYHVITYGANQMWSYENKLTDMERWAVVNYVRALQRAEYPEPRDLERVRSDQ